MKFFSAFGIPLILILSGCGDSGSSVSSPSGATSSTQFENMDLDIATFQIARPKDTNRSVNEYNLKTPAIKIAEDLGTPIPIPQADVKGMYAIDAMATSLGGKCHTGRGFPKSEWGIKKGESVQLSASIFNTDKFAAKRAEWDSTVRSIAALHRMDPNVIHGIITQESAYNPKAYNKGSGATGMMQIMEITQKDLKMGPGDAWIPEKNIEGGTRYFARQMKGFKNNVALALAAYNSGPGYVQWCGDVIPPFAETHGYVKNIVGYANLYSQGPTASTTSTAAKKSTPAKK